ncbi:hypothetical protein [Pseudonocardia humida]|uniref:Secreted protein n=1 Tax=Pseudonocardia humida TaxID=2800819 RepID=A0ABT0ZU41_9PSEU|nr:hypothetical protein [Pseudonocardia humida]MCO1654234.1 hypothetical protein [Pseudonocardia humida]
MAAVVATAAVAFGLSATSAAADELSQPFGGDDLVPIDFVPIDFVPIDFVPIGAQGAVPISALALLTGAGSGFVPI